MLTSQSTQLKENLEAVKEENEELSAQCEVLEEEYNKLLTAQNNNEYIQQMQQMKTSFTKSRSSRHRHRKREKDSFVGEGGLGSELKGLEYKNEPVKMEYDEV
jgi:hypothetical protein